MTPVPLVSICIPCHNAGPYLGAALDSVLAQSWPKIEIIVVDDGSTDDSGRILQNYTKHGLVVINDQLGSAAKSRNRAAREATGDFLKFFDADDLMSPDMIKEQVEAIGPDEVVATCAWGRFYSDDRDTYRQDEDFVDHNLSGADWLIQSWKNGYPMMQPGIFLLPRKTWERTGQWDESLSLDDDFEYYARTLASCSEVRYVKNATLYYRSGLANSLSATTSRKAIESAHRALLEGTGHLLKVRSDKSAKLSCANMLQKFIYTYYPDHPDLLRNIELRISELEGASLVPSGPPRFQKLASFVGWKFARRIQRLAGH